MRRYRDCMLYDGWGQGVDDGIVWLECGGDEELGVVVAEDRCLAIGEEIHDGVLYFGVWERVAADVASTRVPLEELEIRDEDSMAVSAGEEAVGVGHVNH